ncbi:MAG: HEAT repeat domain-containing protein [Oscillospiraceae bacterium]|nr:HEAT repeat domain-containing protein [Oscillospiraceae bacterium]
MQSLEELEQWCQTLREQRQKPFALANALGHSDYLDYHFNFLAGKEEFDCIIWRNFYLHREKAIPFLLTKLELEEDEIARAEMIMMLGKTVDEIMKNYRECFTPEMQAAVLEATLNGIETGSDMEREASVIVLGWVGSWPQVELLGKLMNEDQSEKVRAWAASSLMQMSTRMKESELDALAEATADDFLSAIEKETNPFTAGVIISALAGVFDRSFNLPQKAVEEGDLDLIEKARERAIRFLQGRKEMAENGLK